MSAERGALAEQYDTNAEQPFLRRLFRSQHLRKNVQESVYAAFSHFGALFSVRICPNAAVVHPGYYAIVKFYSAAHAGRAQEATNNTGVFQEAPLKVRLCTQQNPGFLQNVRPLSSTKCYDLANYYLGFNGWSLHIVTMKDISQLDEKENLSLLEEVQTPTLKYGCIVELIFTEYQVRCRGYGVAQEFVEKDADPLEKITKRAKLQKWAKERAVADAFQRVLLVVLGYSLKMNYITFLGYILLSTVIRPVEDPTMLTVVDILRDIGGHVPKECTGMKNMYVNFRMSRRIDGNHLRMYLQQRSHRRTDTYDDKRYKPDYVTLPQEDRPGSRLAMHSYRPSSCPYTATRDPEQALTAVTATDVFR
ncbi:RDM1 protein, partial [Polypterus senegalus]